MYFYFRYIPVGGVHTNAKSVNTGYNYYCLNKYMLYCTEIKCVAHR